MGDKVDPNIVAPSRHAIFIRGLPGTIKVDEVRDFFCRDGHKCRVDFHSMSDDKRRLFVALRFDSHEMAREMKHRYHGKEVLNHDVEISWFKDLRKARAKLLDMRFPADPRAFAPRERMRYNGGGMMRTAMGDRSGGFGDRRFYGPRKPFFQGGPGGFMARGGYRRPPYSGGGHFNRHSPSFGGRYKDRSVGSGGDRASGFGRRRRSYSGDRSPRSTSIMSDDYDSRSRSSMSRSRSPQRDHGRNRVRSPSTGGSRSPLDDHHGARRSRRRLSRSRSRTSSIDESGRDSSDDSDDSDLADRRRRRRRRRRHTEDSSSGQDHSGLVSHSAIVASQHPGGSGSDSANSSSGELRTPAQKTDPMGGVPGSTSGGAAAAEGLSLGGGGGGHFDSSGAGFRALSPVAPAVSMAASVPLACIPTPSEMDLASNPQLSERRTMSRSKSPLVVAEKKKKKKKKKTKNKRPSRSPESIGRASSKSSRVDADSKPHTPPDSMDDDDDAEEGQIKETLLRKLKRPIAKREKERNTSVPAEAVENAGNHQELSSSQLKLLKHKKSIIEKAYKKDCRTFAAVVKVLISKNPDLEERLQASLRDVLAEIGQRCIEDLREYLRSLIGVSGEDHHHSMERASSAESWHHGHGASALAVGGGGGVSGMGRAAPPRFDRQRAMAAAALEEGEAEESLPSVGSPLAHQQRPSGRSALFGRDSMKL